MLLTFSFAPMASASDRVYLEELIQRTRQQRLSERREWIRLLHYKPARMSSGVTSSVDSKTFFNASSGKNDPAAELESTLARFFFSAPLVDKNQHPQCIFVARYQWLKQRLNFDGRRLPEQPCPRYIAWISKIDPQGVALIFPAAYLNNPASMFGHTLLRIESSAHSEHTRLLSYTVNFAADTDEERGVRYAFKGFFGRYPGRFSVSNYYHKVKEYGDIENRDIWEYHLTLTAEETRRMLMHVWELRAVYFDYFFLDENCSYQLLSLIEVARPSLNLTDQFNWWAIPSDTIRAIAAAPNLLKQVSYRPSRSTILRRRVHTLEARIQDIAYALAVSKMAPDDIEMRGLTPIDQAKTLELALEYLAYRKASDKGLRAELERRTLALLKVRNRLDVPEQRPQLKAPEIRPDQGHKTSRLGVGYGFDGGYPFVGFQYRHSYHDLLDPAGGFLEGAQVEFLSAEFRYYHNRSNTGKVNLERFRLIDILSVPLRDPFLKPFAWKANIGVERKRFSDNQSAIVGEANGGVGVSYRITAHSTMYAFGEGTIDLSDRFNQNIGIALGTSAGVFWDFSKRWRVAFSGRFLQYVQGVTDSTYQIRLSQRVQLTEQSALNLDITRTRDFGNAFTAASLIWRFYF